MSEELFLLIALISVIGGFAVFIAGGCWISSTMERRKFNRLVKQGHLTTPYIETNVMGDGSIKYTPHRYDPIYDDYGFRNRFEESPDYYYKNYNSDRSDWRWKKREYLDSKEQAIKIIQDELSEKLSKTVVCTQIESVDLDVNYEKDGVSIQPVRN